jgi:hypothetical protein
MPSSADRDTAHDAEPGAAPDTARVTGFWDFKLSRAAGAGELGRWLASAGNARTIQLTAG